MVTTHPHHPLPHIHFSPLLGLILTNQPYRTIIFGKIRHRTLYAKEKIQIHTHLEITYLK